MEHFQKENFISNTSNITEEEKIWLITGPNMAGKSTFLRQNALICILAQIGSYVPAKKVHIGVVDKIFSRIGAADNIAKGESTFMVEMTETAYIINNATRKSLVNFFFYFNLKLMFNNIFFAVLINGSIHKEP